MKIKLASILVLLSIFLSSCNNSNNIIYQHPIDGTWEFHGEYGGFGAPNIYFKDEIKWTFNNSENELIIEENFISERNALKFNHYQTAGKHSFEIKKEDSKEVLYINEKKIGIFTIKNNKLFLDDNRFLDGSVHEFRKDNIFKDVTSALIGKGNLFGNGEEDITQQNLIIKDKSAWDTLITKMNTVNIVSNSFSEQEIDFSKYTIIASFMNVQSYAGHDLILETTSDNQKVYVKVKDLYPQGNVPTALTQPYAIIKISNTDLPIVFE